MPKKSDAKPGEPIAFTEKKAKAKKKPVKIQVEEFDFALADIEAGLIPEDMELPDCMFWANCCWIKNGDAGECIAGVTVNTRLDWEKGLLVSLKYIVEFDLKTKITKDQLENAAGDLMAPVWNDAAYVTSFITERFIGVPIILSPEVEMIEFEDYEEAQERDE